MTTAIVVGATGLIGEALVEQLANDNTITKIIAVTRRNVPFNSPKVVNKVIDFENLNQYSLVFKGDILFSCLGTTRKLAGSIQNQRRVDLDYQYQIARLARDNDVKHYLLVSSSGANAQSRSAYLQMKGELENKVTQLDFESTSILRPSLLLGHRNHFRLGETIGSYILPFLCKLPGLARYRPITGVQVAKKLVQVAKGPDNKHQVFSLDELFC